MNNDDKDQDLGVRLAAHLVGPDTEAPVEWKELRDGQVGKVGPGHLNHLEGGERCVLRGEGGGHVLCRVKAQMTTLPHKTIP